MLPVTIDRVPHSENKYDFSVIQAESVLDKVPQGDISIIVGDSAYSCNKFIYKLSKRDNVAVITRMRVNKAIYQNMKIKKKVLGEKENMAINICLTNLIYYLIQTIQKNLKNNKERINSKDQVIII